MKGLYSHAIGYSVDIPIFNLYKRVSTFDVTEAFVAR